MEFRCIPADLGSSNLLKLTEKSPHFMQSLVVLDSDVEESDGDKQNDKLTLAAKENVIMLPVTDKHSIYHALPPDKLAYWFLFEKYQNEVREFWTDKTPYWFNNDYYLEHVNPLEPEDNVKEVSEIDDLKKTNRKLMKKWYKKNRDNFLNLNIYKIFVEENKELCQEFVDLISEKVNILNEKYELTNETLSISS